MFTMDGDLQNDPADIPMLLDHMKDGVDVVSGWRKDRKDPFEPAPASLLANALISWITGVPPARLRLRLEGLSPISSETSTCMARCHRSCRAGQLGWRTDRRGWLITTRAASEIQIRSVAHLQGGSRPVTVKFLTRYSTLRSRCSDGWGVVRTCGLLMMLVMIAANLRITCSGHRLWPSHQASFLGHDVIYARVLRHSIYQQGLLAELQTRTYHESQDKPFT